MKETAEVPEIQQALSRVKLLWGVCGSFSAIAVPHVNAWLRGVVGVREVRTIMTRQAQDLMGPRMIETVTGHRPVTDWEDHRGIGAAHVALGAWADVLVVLPATANFLAKAAHGIADDVLTSTLLAADCPVVIAPVMNAAMWSKPAVRRNAEQLRIDGYHLVEPQDGVSLTEGHQETGSLGDFRPVISAALVKAAAHAARAEGQ
ncbi:MULTISPECIES: flavoprotein [Streptomyces]|uniref:Flavoprotein n=1 Tax=Streptomyces mutomycini TaxID=284036 RepID=A0ABW0B8D9_9ACTN|nr:MULTISPECIES: flavoprotein [Streptomyces]